MDTSIYKSITNYLLELISRNAKTPNYKLPSERMLATHFDVSRKPVRHAYDELIERGYVMRIHGSGYYISSTAPEQLQTSFQKNIRISFIIPAVVTQYSHALLSGVSEFCAKNKVEYSIHVSDGLPDKEESLIRSATRSGSMGIILFPVDNDTGYHSELPRNDTQITTEPGDIVLYSGNQIVVFHGSNSCAYTPLGRILGMEQSALTDLLGNGAVTVTLSVS